MKLLGVVLLAAAAIILSPLANAQQGIAPNPDLATLCNKAQIYDTATSNPTLLVSGTATAQIYVCGFTFWAPTTSNVGLVYGTGPTCGTGQQKVTPLFQFTAGNGIADHVPIYQGLTPAPPSNNLCLNTTGTGSVEAIVYFSQF